MKKKVVWTVSMIVSLGLLVAMICFVLLGGHSKKTEVYDVTGTWKVVAMVENDVPVFLDCEYMTFNEPQACDYRDNLDTPFVTSKYRVTEKNALELQDLGKKYVIEAKTDNICRLYEDDKKYLLLVRCEMTNTMEYLHSELEGEWDVVYRHSDSPMEEILLFDENTISDFRNGEGKAVSVSVYEWVEEDILRAELWKKDFIYIPISKDIMVFVEGDTGYEWELHRKQ